MGKLLVFLICCQMVLVSKAGLIQKKSGGSHSNPNALTMFYMVNELWAHESKKLDMCDVSLNYEKKDERGGPKLFEKVKPNLFDEHADFRAFQLAYYRTRNEVKNGPIEIEGTYEKRKPILEEFIGSIEDLTVYKEFEKIVKNYPWFDNSNYRQKLIDLWLPSDNNENAGFDFNFMGNIKANKKIQGEYGGLNNWVGYYLSERDNLVHYTGGPPLTNTHYDIINDVSFTFIDNLSNQNFLDNKPEGNGKLPAPSVKAHKTKHSMLLMTTPAFEFCMYSLVALIDTTKREGVPEDFKEKNSNPQEPGLVTREANIQIHGCKIKITMKLRENADKSYIQEFSPTVIDPKECIFANLAFYRGPLVRCLETDNNQLITHLQQNITSSFDILL